MKLEGIRVVDLSVFLPGPYLTMSLADHGAEVIKVEPPGGDPGREIGPRQDGETVFFRLMNRGKNSVVLDLKSDDGRAALLRLCDGADVFVESFRPGVMQRLGFDYATLAKRNPRLVYCSISAFGQDGPYRDLPAHDLAVEALGGALSITVGADGEPAIPGIPAADMLSSLQGLSAILMALLRREKTGQGDYIDMAMYDAVLAAYPNVLGPAFAEDRDLVPSEERSMGGSAFYRIYRTADGRHVVLGGQEIKFVRNLLEALGRPDFVPLCERGPGPHQKPLIDFLAGVFASRTQAEWVAWFEGRDICFAPVKTLREALDAPHARHRGMLVTDERGHAHVGPAIKFAREPSRPSLRTPGLGKHNDDIIGAGRNLAARHAQEAS
jgi:crotonobetainyl-CoA:carnitine CoA-transferase CaiB-like acyl-CoA transferase